MGFNLRHIVEQLGGHQSQTGHPQFSAAVRAQNAAPAQNQFNSNGQPTYEVLSDLDGNMISHPTPHPDNVSQWAAPRLTSGAPTLQGRENVGYIPLQHSGIGGNPQLRAFSNPQTLRGMMNPQVSDTGYYYDN